MTETPALDAAVRIAQLAIGYGRHEHARTVVAALAHAGWLHGPAEVATLRAVADAAGNLLDRLDGEGCGHALMAGAAMRRRLDALPARETAAEQ